MICASCGTPAAATARFCSQCGQRLSAAPLPSPSPRSYTPRHLAEKILSSRSAMQGERKQVTVLFADVKGSMELAERVEAETWHGILNRFFAILADGVHRFEGTINQYTGDGIMALFGAPIAHEDHAQRACHAALELRVALRRYADELRVEHGLSFSVRMGINSGEVVIGRIGDDLRMDYTAQGHTVGLAARLEQLAEPGTALLSQDTAHRVTGYFALRDLGATQVKGVNAPVQVFELQGSGPLQTRLEKSRARGFATFVGRQAELGVLDRGLEAALLGTGSVVGIRGEPGLGKSRLCDELLNRCRGHAVQVYQAHCPSHGRSVPFLPILSLLRSYFRIDEQDGAARARERIAGRMLVHDDASRDLLPVLYDFLGVADPGQPAPHLDPEARQRVLFSFVRTLVSGGEPAVLLIDDLHWIDSASDAFVAELVAAVPQTRTFLLLNYRPEYHAPWMQRSWFRELTLGPLSPVAAGALLDELLGEDPALAPLRALIHERAGGNPFFIEEIVDSLLSDGALARSAEGLVTSRPIGSISIPDSVQAVLAARIDRLSDGDKGLLQTAAVIGKTFDTQLLARVLETLGEADISEPRCALPRLADAGLVRLATDDRLTFKHPLTHEVAYHSQLSARRERVHRAVAAVLEETHRDHLDEAAALLAYHAAQAGDAVAAAEWHRRAAEWVGVKDIAEGSRHWQRALELAAAAPETPATIAIRLTAGVRLLDLGWRAGMSPQAAEPIFAAGRALAERVGDVVSIASYLNAYGLVVGMSGDIDRGLELVSEAAALAYASDDAGIKLVATVALVQAQAMAGALREALATLDGALQVEPTDLNFGAFASVFSPYLYLLMMRGHIRTEMGELSAARPDLERVLRSARERGQIELLGWAHEFAVYLELAGGDQERALEHARRAVEGAEKIGSPLSRASAQYALSAAQIARGSWQEAIVASELGLSTIRARATGRHWEARGLAFLAEALAGSGEHERARTVAAEAEAASLRGGNRAVECISCLSIARALRRCDDPSGLERNLARLESIVAATGARLYQSWIDAERKALAPSRPPA